MKNTAVGLAAFDLDGTLLKGETVCEAIAHGIGRIERMRELEQLQYNQVSEIAAAREEMARWYSSFSLDELCARLAEMRLATGLEEGFELLRGNDYHLAIISVTWEFAVKWFAKRLGADYHVGVGLSSSGRITHFGPEDKALWLRNLARGLGLHMRDVAAVGDSSGDIAMLEAAGHSFWVGERVPHVLAGRAIHQPNGDIAEIARQIVMNQRRLR